MFKEDSQRGAAVCSAVAELLSQGQRAAAERRGRRRTGRENKEEGRRGEETRLRGKGQPPGCPRRCADMNDIKLALLGSRGAGKSAVLVRFLTKRFIGEYASNTNSLYRKRLSIDGRQLNLEVFDPCSQQNVESRCILEEPVDWADGFVVVYDISDRLSFLNAKNVLCQIKEARMESCKSEADVPVCLVGNKQDLCHVRQVSEDEGRSLAQEHKCPFQEVSAAEDHQEISGLFTKLIRGVMEHLKHRTDRRRYSGSKSMVKLINNVFGKRRKSV
ncbi:ras-related and estrogen-regulated growth inhibitor-like protein [Arapaima gigas]